MSLNRLNFEQYFINTSNDRAETGKATRHIDYTDVPYEYDGLICHANYDIYFDERRNVIQINFQETNGAKDWFVNFMFVDKYYKSFDWNRKKITLKVHNGWAAMYKAVKHRVRNEVTRLLSLHPSAEVEVIGWSLGSGQAMLCVQDLNYNLGIKCHLFTYGSVSPFKTNIFNRSKIKKYLRSCCKQVYNFSDLSDIVTYMPFRLLGFIKIKRVNVGSFNLIHLFKPIIYHSHYYKSELYRNIA